MAERKPISKKKRFEVFKRDQFTCQYCGRKAPDVILEVDHIKPVSKGGTNGMLNLVTSCRECNRGKTNIELSDDTVVKKQQKQLEELAEKKEQLDMLLQWRSSLEEIENDYVDAVADVFATKTMWKPVKRSREKIKSWLKQYSLTEVLAACDIAISRYYDGSEESWNETFNKVSGICYLEKNSDDKKSLYYVNYICKALKNNGFYCDRGYVKEIVQGYVGSDDDFLVVKRCLRDARNWTMFKNFVCDSLIPIKERKNADI